MEPKEAARPHSTINPFGDAYKDNDEAKNIFLQAWGLEPEYNDPNTRHVLLRWMNGEDEIGTRYTQIIHLTGHPGNRWEFHSIQVKAQSNDSLKRNTFYDLGSYSRAQRDRILGLADAVRFKPVSSVNNCQTWMRDLLEAMVDDDLLSLEKFKEYEKEIPLKKRVSEDDLND